MEEVKELSQKVAEAPVEDSSKFKEFTPEELALAEDLRKMMREKLRGPEGLERYKKMADFIERIKEKHPEPQRCLLFNVLGGSGDVAGSMYEFDFSDGESVQRFIEEKL